jgi:hypothetical protein
VSADLLLPVIASLAWLFFAASAFASFRLGWSGTLKLALLWIAIFGGLFLIVEWFTTVRDTASGFV